MDESDDILNRPLGVAAPATPSRRPTIPLSGRTLGFVTLGGLLLGGTGLALFGDPEGGEPRVQAAIVLRTPPPPTAVAEPAASPSQGPIRRTAEQIEQESGVTVTRAAGGKAPDVAVIIGVPNADAPRLAAAPDPRLIERNRHGALPRIGEGRIRPLDVYARPSGTETGAGRIAILVSGIGVGDMATAAAITRLPGEVSLAVNPYAHEVDKTAARARLAGHEVLLQVPMEPFDYPDSDPGPRTLLAASRPGENLERLAWAMSRFPGFIGLVNFMGGKFASEAAALEPVLKEAAARGLAYVEDGTLARSTAASIAPKTRTPFAQARSVIDAVARPEAIDAELRKLEDKAKGGEIVFGAASASPMTIERIASWVKGLEARGISLVPVSAVLRAPPSTKLSKAD